MAAALSPRQRMINLMYLVFIAMLALNMSKEVLVAFGVVNEKLIDNNQSLIKKNTLAIRALEEKSIESPDQFKTIWKKVQVVSSASDALYKYLEDLKTSLEKTVTDPKDYESMDNSSAFDERFYEGSGSEIPTFNENMTVYKNSVVEAVSKDFPELSERISKDFDVQTKIKDGEGVEKTYIDYHFIGYPLISIVAKLSFLQNNIINYENEILTYFLSGQLAKIASMTNYTTLLEMEKSAFYSGEVFDGSVVLGRKDNETKPNSVFLKLGNRTLSPSEYSISQGKVKLNVRLGDPGDYKLTGNLVFLENKEKIDVPVNSTISVIRRPSQAVISAEKMNVVYRGVDNPISISLPGVPSNKINVSAPGMQQVGSSYIMRPDRIAGREVEIKVSAAIDGVTVNSNKVFRIKDVPRPTGTFLGQPESIALPIENVEKGIVGAILEDFDFDIKLIVNNFKVYVPGQPSISVQGNKMDASAQRLVRRARKGDIIQVFDINASIIGNTNYKLKKVSTVTVEVR